MLFLNILSYVSEGSQLISNKKIYTRKVKIKVKYDNVKP